MSLTDTARIVLEKVDLFNGLSREDLEAINNFLVCRQLPQGAVLFEEGQFGDSLYIVRKGEVSILKEFDEGSTELTRRGKGEMFGEMALIDSSPCFASAVCATEVEVFVLSQERFYEILQHQPGIAARILRVLAARIRETDNTHLRKLETKNKDLEQAYTSLEQLLQQLQKSNNQLEAALSFRDRVIAVSPYPAIVTDNRNQVRLINPAAAWLFGQNMTGDLWGWLTPVNPDDVDSIESALSRRSTWKGEIEIYNAGQQTTICKLVAAPIAETGEGDSARLWIFEDLSEIRLLERQALQREQLAMKGEMAAEIAHELNNFLAVLQGNAELLSMTVGDTADAKLKKRLDTICSTVDRIRVFTDNMLNSRHPGAQRTDININEFLENQIAFLKPQKRIKRRVIETEWGEGLPSLNCDPSAIQQIFYNLMLNAADALTESDPEHNTIRVRTSQQHNPEAIVLTVSDNGPGIPPELLKSLFTQRVSSKPTGHGFGLLTIARLVQEHGGTVRGENRPEGGAVFTVVLPLNRATD